jgi:hypothetical protein
MLLIPNTISKNVPASAAQNMGSTKTFRENEPLFTSSKDV